MQRCRLNIVKIIVTTSTSPLPKVNDLKMNMLNLSIYDVMTYGTIIV